MSAEVTKAIRRLLAVYGTPKTEEPEILFDEFRKALTGFRADILAKGIDAVIKDRAFSNWPTVGEVVQACRDVGAAMSDSFAPEHKKLGHDWKRQPVDPVMAKLLLDGFSKAMEAGNTFADIKARFNATGPGATMDVSAPWGEEVRDRQGNIVPIRKRSAA